MSQNAVLLTRVGAIEVELPSQEAEVLPGVRWGAVEAFPSPAYFAFHVIARRLTARSLSYRLGRTLREEVGACLLGGHGIPGALGVAAYEHLRAKGAFRDGTLPTIDQLEEWLKTPIQVGARKVRYRFAAQKAQYLASAMRNLQDVPSFRCGRDLRDWLLRIPGVGLKTASWVARNWLDANDVAILDIHIMRVGRLIGLFSAQLTVEKDYVELERLFLRFSAAMDVLPSELDAVIWNEMASSPASAQRVVEFLRLCDSQREYASGKDRNQRAGAAAKAPPIAAIPTPQSRLSSGRRSLGRKSPSIPSGQ